MEPNRYPHVTRLLVESPWAILPGKLAAIRELVADRATGHRRTPEEIEAALDANGGRQAAVTRSGLTITGGVAILPLYGVLMPKATLFSEISGASSVQQFTAQLQDAVANDQVAQILIDVNSPGGLTDMIPEAAAQLRAARQQKPITAVANTIAASAAYWLASQADELVVTPSGEVGSIGVFCEHDDISGQLAQEGIQVTLVSAGRYKTEANPYEPLSDDALNALQDQVDQFYGMFLADVAAGRGTDAQTVEADYGQGRMLTARDALAAGMVDRVATFDQTLQRLAAPPAAAGTKRRNLPNALSGSDKPADAPPAPRDTWELTQGLYEQLIKEN